MNKQPLASQRFESLIKAEQMKGYTLMPLNLLLNRSAALFVFWEWA
ncbi:hypothetical protein [Providencia rettgeri]